MTNFTKYLCALLLVVVTTQCHADVFLPGMQPKEAGIEFAKVQQCSMCHSKTKNGNADPYLSWKSGMMSVSAKDPLFRAALAIANQDIEGIGEFCLRCHAPRAWLEGRSTPSDGSALNQEDLYGVSCTVCHSFIDPMSDEASELVKDTPCAYGNAMFVSDPENVVYGPYGDGKGAMPHTVKKSDFHASSNLCGTCHNISNPLLAEDVKTQPPFMFGHIQRTYSEWLLSDFAKQGKEGTCQACHYPPAQGGGQASRYTKIQRDHFAIHGPAGGSTWIQDAAWKIWKGKDLDRKALELSKQKALEMLNDSADLELTFNGSSSGALKVINKTGHKLPTGYEEGRRMWINLLFLDSSGQVIDEIGKYGEKSDTILGEPVKAPTVLDPDRTRVYEILFAISEKQAEKYNVKPGKSFHSVLNDTVLKDNRVPPKGFSNAAFEKHLSKPVGAEYANGQYWDQFEFSVPQGCSKVVAKLMYQSVSWEYLKFLVDENKTDEWGKKIYEAWKVTGKCEPTVAALIEKTLGD